MAREFNRVGCVSKSISKNKPAHRISEIGEPNVKIIARKFLKTRGTQRDF